MIFDTLIIGGGLAGLSALHKLMKENRSVHLLEKDERVGGLVKSFNRDGFLLETGPTAFLKGYKDTMGFVEELGLQDDVRFNIPGADNRYVYRNSAIHPIPEGPFSFIKTPLFPLKAKLRMMLEPFVGKAKSDEESVYSFGKRRFGEDVSSTVMDAMVSGVCAGDFKKLDIFSLFPKIGMIEEKFRSFLLFLLLFKIKSKEKNKDNKSVTFRSFDSGMGSIAARAENIYRKNISLNSPVDRIEHIDGVYSIWVNGKSFQSKKLVMACPANTAAELLSEVHTGLAENLARIPYSSIATCLLGYKKEQVSHPMKGFGFLVPRNQGLRILGGLFSSGLFEHRTPEGHVSIKVYIGGSHDSEIQSMPNDEIISIISSELKGPLNIKGGPCFTHVNKISSAIPQYHMGHRDIKRAIYQELQKIPGLSLAGNYLEGISVNEAIRSGAMVG
ncbi:MAG: protoporphyrinogen oxidase [Bacteriovoracaceae bacterium]|nr:protoporphyrinogen oxidase [Bacteriovoracaceae bacterium]